MTDKNVSNSAQPEQNNSESLWSRHTAGKVLKLLSIIAFFTVFVLNSTNGVLHPSGFEGCIDDRFQAEFSSVHADAITGAFNTTGMNIFTGLLEDSIFVGAWFVYFKSGKTARMPVVIALIAVLGFFMQFITILKPNSNAIQEYPGFPSLMISYISRMRTFFSVEIAMLSVFFFEFMSKNCSASKFAALMTVFTLILRIFGLSVLRQGYSVDWIFGLLVGHYGFVLYNDKLKQLDGFFFNDKKDENIYANYNLVRSDEL